MFSRTLSGMARLSAVRSPATRPMPSRIAAPGPSRASVRTRQHDAAAIDRGQPEQGPAHLLLPGAAQPDQRQHLAGAQGQRERPDLADLQLVQLQRDGPAAGLGAHEHLLGRPPDDHRHQLPGCRRRHRLAPHQPAVAQHGHLVRHLEDLVQAMGHVDHADIAPAQPAQDGHQPGHLVGRQAGGRLVEHDDLGLDGECPGDRDQGLLGPRQPAHPRIRIDHAADRGQCVARAVPCLPPADQSEPAREAQSHRHVLGDRHPVDQAQILMDEGDRLPLAGDRRAVLIVLPMHQNLPFVGLMDAGQHLDQGRLAGTVLAEHARISPAWRSRLTSLTATVPPKRLETWENRSSGASITGDEPCPTGAPGHSSASPALSWRDLALRRVG